MTIKILTVVLIYKIAVIGSVTVSVSALIIPLWFFLGDVIAEVYGYNVSRQLIWIALFCQFIFAILCTTFIKLPSPLYLHHQSAYEQVLGPLLRVVTASFLAVVCGAFLNAYALTKWKMLLHGKYFWLRSIFATAIGEAIFTIIAYVVEFSGVVPPGKLIQLIISSYSIKLLVDPVIIIPSLLLANFLKKSEGLDVYDYETDFNPFKLSIDNNTSST